MCYYPVCYCPEKCYAWEEETGEEIEFKGNCGCKPKECTCGEDCRCGEDDDEEDPEADRN